MKTLYDAVKPEISVRAQSASTSVNGSSVDTQGYNNAFVQCDVGAASGSPTAQSVTYKVQESSDNSTFTDISGAVTSAITANNKSAQINLIGLGLNIARYIRVVATISFTGGTTPAIPVASSVLLGRAFEEPVGNSTIGA